MKVFAIRHGQTKLNAEGRIQGRSDLSLNEIGKAQAKNIINSIPNKIDDIFVSPLKRAIETAEIINRKFGVNIIIDNLLIERDFGDFEGELMSTIDINSLRRWTDNTKIPNGETIRDVQKRVFTFLDKIKDDYKDKTILIVAHGHVLRPIKWYFDGLPKEGEEIVIETETGSFMFFDL